jgi:hypothetical protein
MVPTQVAHDEADIMAAHKKFVAAGYEGTMIRDDSAGYEIAQRAYQLQKLKDFQDAEFRIVDVVSGGGSHSNVPRFVCENKKGIQFNCVPEGDMGKREEMFKNRKSYIGKWLTIRYQTLTKDGVPQFPVGVDVRDDGEF